MTQTQKSFWIITDEANNETNYLTFDSFKNAILKNNPTDWINNMTDETFNNIEDYLETFRIPSEGEIKCGDTTYFIQHAYYGTEEELHMDFFNK
jgi:hypothetical protein